MNEERKIPNFIALKNLSLKIKSYIDNKLQFISDLKTDKLTINSNFCFSKNNDDNFGTISISDSNDTEDLVLKLSTDINNRPTAQFYSENNESVIVQAAGAPYNDNDLTNKKYVDEQINNININSETPVQVIIHRSSSGSEGSQNILSWSSSVPLTENSIQNGKRQILFIIYDNVLNKKIITSNIVYETYNYNAGVPGFLISGDYTIFDNNNIIQQYHITIDPITSNITFQIV